MIKKLTLSLFLLMLSVVMNAQLINRPATNNGVLYLSRLMMGNYMGELKDYTDNYLVKIVFNIDTSGKIINCRADNKVVAVPEAVEQYVIKQVLRTIGPWLPEIKESKTVISSNISFFFWISTKPREPIAEHLDEVKDWKIFSPNNYNPFVDNMYTDNSYGFYLQLPAKTAPTKGMVF